MEFTAEFKDGAKNFIKDWDLLNPVDYLWRQHYNIPFGSKAHLEASFIDQQLWFDEREFIKELQDKMNDDKENEPIEFTDASGNKQVYKPNENNGVKMSKEEEDKFFDDIEIGKTTEEQKIVTPK